ncbi:NupC/NupG family nucleoside CNT transporter [Verrucomicrobiota bacterium]
MSYYNLVSFCGIFVLVGVGWAISSDRRRMNWRVLGWGVALQLLFGAFVFLVPAGTTLFLFVNKAVVKLLDSASAGAHFVFGRLAVGPGATNEAGESSLGFILAFQAFPTIVFFSALMAILYYWGIMPRIIRGFAFVFTRLMRVSGAESLSAASNIFVGVESALTIKPYLPDMTRSELCTVLTAGMATVASNVLALYVLFLRDAFPNIAGHFVSASILSAPAALAMSKVVLPEAETPHTLGKAVDVHYERESSLFEAIIAGANSGMRLIFGIVALLLAVLGLVALVDMVLGWTGAGVNGLMGWDGVWSLKGALGYLFRPFTVVLGVPWSDIGVISGIIGERTVATEVAGYRDLAAALGSGLVVHRRSAIIATYALCGFAHVASMAIFVGGISALAPAKTRELADVSGRALLAATLACLMTACVAGTFATDRSILFGD